MQPLRRVSPRVIIATLLFVSTMFNAAAIADQTATFDNLQSRYADAVRPLLKQFCLECHSSELQEGEFDLQRFATLGDVRRDPPAWQKVAEMLDNGEMPPADSKQPSKAERQQLRQWIGAYLDAEALANAGDPGPVILRRLSNAEYTYTMRDLTGIDALDPTREFPVDGAAGEGFTNSGSAQAMSPSLVQKYLDAAKEIARHAAFYPDGIRFSRHTSRRDLTDELLAKIRAFYARYSVDGKGTAVNLQGIQFDTNQGGILPLADYLTATIAERDALRSGAKTIGDVARQRKLSPVYLQTLWHRLNDPTYEASFLLRQIRERWQGVEEKDIPQFDAEIAAWQKQLWKLNVVGHLGREGAPTSWMEPINPVVDRQEFQLELPSPADGQDVVVYLSAGDAGDGREDDFVLWRDMRLTAPGQPAINLRDARGIAKRRRQLRGEALANTVACLAAASELTGQTEFAPSDLARAAEKHAVKPAWLRVWLNYLAIGVGGPVEVEGHFQEKMEKSSNYDFINGWGTGATPLVVANSSDQQVRIPGISRPHSLVVHPSPTLFAAVGWRSPMDGFVQVDASLSDAHPECGNGVEWFVQYRSGSAATTLWKGDFPVGGSAKMPPKTIAVGKGELISFIVGPRAGAHTCDLTAIDLTITETTGAKRVWDVAEDNSPNILHSNPHPDSHGNNGTWHFYQGPMSGVNAEHSQASSVPAGSLLARWLKEPDQRATLAKQIAVLATGPPPAADKRATPDGVLYRNLHSLELPVAGELIDGVEQDARFGKHPLGHAIDSNHLVIQAPATIEFRIPSEIAAARKLVITGMVDVDHGRDGATQLHVGLTPPDHGVPKGNPFICANGSNARKQVEAALREIRELFPPALCYTRIVPVDEVVTAILFHREDDLYKRLMLTEEQSAQLDRLWDELFYVAEEPLKAVVALEQIREFSTQDRQDLVPQWDKLTPLVAARAEAFRKRVKETEPAHLESVVQIADRAWRRRLRGDEQQSLRELYGQLRASEIPHEEAIRLTLARALASPNLLYRREQPGPGDAPVTVSGDELASRLSYFIWSSTPDVELRNAAQAGNLIDHETLVAQTRRMLKDPRTRRLAIQFACQWLHVRDFDQNAEKNEKLYPEFASLRGGMYEETVRFFEDMFRNDGSVLGLLNADHTFLDEALARHYGIEGVSGAAWRRVDGVRSQGRGGILGMATVLASQSGASRTSPILRGNWVYETLLGERLPRPPANVPQLPDERPQGLTARQLIQQHSSVAACAKCHAKIDPYGFALEQFDAIGRRRPQAVDTQTKLADGRTIDGLDGLRDYLANERQTDILRQFCRKLLGYSLGREVQLSDRPLLDTMMRDLAQNNFRFSVAVETIVLSEQFRKIRGSAQE